MHTWLAESGLSVDEDGLVDNLKRSLEKAIEELRDTAPAERHAPPAPHSIEAALALAPSVSPHYRPTDHAPRRETVAPARSSVHAHQLPAVDEDFGLPPLPPRPEELVDFALASQPVEPPAMSLARSAMVRASRAAAGAAPEPSRAAPPTAPARPRTHEAVAQALAATELASARLQSPHRYAEPGLPERSGPAMPPPGLPAADPVEDTEAAALKLRRERRKIAAIVFASCVGGLASGWFGAMLADNARSTNGKVATSDISGAFTEMATPSSGVAVTPGAYTGKADRVLPVDESRCTVLELDRSTGLTLARPCRDLETADVNTTLSKSDLMARP
jgi:hypothetical protein